MTLVNETYNSRPIHWNLNSKSLRSRCIEISYGLYMEIIIWKKSYIDLLLFRRLTKIYLQA